MLLPRRWLGQVLALVVVLLASRPHGANAQVAVISVEAPASLAGNRAGYFADFSKLPVPSGSFKAWVPTDPLGCTMLPLPLPKGDHPLVMVDERGTCTFRQKAQVAQQAGAAGLIIVSNSSQVPPMGDEGDDVGIFVIGVPKAFGDEIRNRTLGQKGDSEASVVMSFAVYTNSLLNPSEAILVCMATALVAAGAFFSTADVSDTREGSFSTALAPPQEEVLEVDSWLAVGFCAVGSGFLLFLFFFMHYMIYFIIGAFCLGGASCIAQFGSICLMHYCPGLKSKAVTVPLVGSFTHAELIATVPAILLVTTWLIHRNDDYGWPAQDIIGAGFLCWLQRTLRLPNIRIASLLLSAMFFFDIFWVFISPFIFQKSVMVTVATGGGTGESVPMLLRIPAIGDPLGNDRLLGFGDIALPGLLVSYLRRHDLMSKRSPCQGYFGPALVGYFIGLCVTIAALCIMRMGQPALLYLVPGTLGTTMVIAWCRGEVMCLWDGVLASDNDHCFAEQQDEDASDSP